jgi:hypothetical protein
MKAKRQIQSSLNSVTMLDGTGGHVTVIFTAVSRDADHGYIFIQAREGACIGCRDSSMVERWVASAWLFREQHFSPHLWSRQPIGFGRHSGT